MCIKFYTIQLDVLHCTKIFFIQAGIYVSLSVIFLSCSDKHQRMDKLADDMADYECRAVTLRNQRFELANKIRFTQDTILQQAGDTIPLHNKLTAMENEKQVLLVQSLQLADTIRQKVDFMLTNYFTDKSKEKEFNQLLDAALKRKGCK